jgi:hypothetical protein
MRQNSKVMLKPLKGFFLAEAERMLGFDVDDSDLTSMATVVTAGARIAEYGEDHPGDATDRINATYAENDGSVIGYMCSIDWECEIGAASDGSTVYPSKEALIEGHGCAEDCGIVEVEVRFRKIVVPRSADY